MTNLIAIDKNVLVNDILDQLEVPDLLHFFTTNKELKEKYLAHFQEKIEDYREDLRHQTEIAILKQQAKFDQFASAIFTLSDKLFRYNSVVESVRFCNISP